MRDFNFSVNSSNLIYSFDLGTEASMYTEGFSVDNGSDWEIVKYFSAVFPWVRVSIFSIDLIIKTIDGCDLSKFN